MLDIQENFLNINIEDINMIYEEDDVINSEETISKKRKINKGKEKIHEENIYEVEKIINHMLMIKENLYFMLNG